MTSGAEGGGAQGPRGGAEGRPVQAASRDALEGKGPRGVAPEAVRLGGSGRLGKRLGAVAVGYKSH